MTRVLAICAFLIAFCIAHAKSDSDILAEKIHAGIPEWMKEQAERDLAHFRGYPLSRKKISDFYESCPKEHYLIRFTIHNNRVTTEWKEKDTPGMDYRREIFEHALKKLAKAVQLPNTTFLLSMHDAYTISGDVPVFSMCKREQDCGAILLPDYDALQAKFQVLPKRDLTSYEPRWEEKATQLVWRGSSAQASLDGELMRADNVDRFSRVILCKLSQQYPALIDAKFTFLAQGGEHIPSLKAFLVPFMSFEQLMQYKYQLFIDGNVTPYSASGWKFFSNSLIFKADSPWYQWYFAALKPFEHYIPVRADLADLVDGILWAKSHENEARMIAKRCRECAISSITLPDNLLYLYYIIDQYSHLDFVE